MSKTRLDKIREEAVELRIKHQALCNFLLKGPEMCVSVLEYDLLKTQELYMREYLNVLTDRIVYVEEQTDD